MTTLLALNVSRPPLPRAEALWAWLASQDADVLVLTEVGAGGGSAWLAERARAAGYAVVGPTQPRDLGVLIIGRGVRLEPDPHPRPAVLPGRVETVRLATADGVLRLAGVYGAASDPVRYASSVQRQRKRDWLDAFVPWVDAWAAGGSGVLIGDLNLVDPVVTDRLPYVLAEETAAYIELCASGLVDAWREKNPDAVGLSWRDHSGVGCRYDHAFVTPDLAGRLASCTLLDAPLAAGLSDHAALALTLRHPRAGD